MRKPINASQRKPCPGLSSGPMYPTYIFAIKPFNRPDIIYQSIWDELHEGLPIVLIGNTDTSDIPLDRTLISTR